jgi:predicted transposase
LLSADDNLTELKISILLYESETRKLNRGGGGLSLVDLFMPINSCSCREGNPQSLEVGESLTIRLETSEEDKITMLENMGKYNEACNFVAEKAFSLKLANKYKLHKEVYREVREKFNQSSQFAVRIIGKVVEVYKRDKTIKPKFRELGSIQYDQRNSRIGIDRISIMTLQANLQQ